MNGSSYFQLLNPLILLIFAGGFAAIYFNDRKLKSAIWLSIAYAAGATGFLLDFLVRDAVGPYFGSFVSNVPFIVALLLVSVGIHELYSDRLPWKAAGAIFVGLFAIVGVIVSIDPNSFARAAAMNVGSAFAYGLALPVLWKAWRSKRGGRIPPVLLTIMTLAVLQSLLRPLMVALVVGVHEPAVSYSSSLYALTLHLASAVTGISLASVLLFSLGMDLVRNLNRAAHEDPMTGLLNRRGLDETSALLMPRLERSDLPFSVVICDIDHFKRVNDRFGHAAGDAVICGCANVLSANLRSADHVARIGGEEFVSLLWNTDENGARTFAESRRKSFASEKFACMPEGEACTASFGIAQWSDGESFENVLARADAALYEAKQTGRNRVCAEPVTEAPVLIAAE